MKLLGVLSTDISSRGLRLRAKTQWIIFRWILELSDFYWRATSICGCGCRRLRCYGMAYFSYWLSCFGFSFVALSTQWHIDFWSTNHIDLSAVPTAECEASALLTQLTDCSELLDLFTLRYKSYDCREKTPLEVALKWWDYDNLSFIGDLLTKLYYVLEEVSFIYTNHIVAWNEMLNFSKLTHCLGLTLDASVRANIWWITCSVLDPQDPLLSNLVPLRASDKLSGFTREHTAQNQLNSPSLLDHWGFWLTLHRLLPLIFDFLYYNILRAILNFHRFWF